MDEETLISEYRIGLEVEAFLKTPGGEYLLACCEQDRLIALEDLSRVNPDDASAIRQIQHRIRVCEAIPSYLQEAVTRSYQAEEALKA